MKIKIYAFIISLLLVACQQKSTEPSTASANNNAVVKPNTTKTLDTFESQPEEIKARYKYRNPRETLAFMGIDPGMTVVEYFPGSRGWYTHILSSYLGSEGVIIGVDYPLGIWRQFRSSTPESLKKRESWLTDWVEQKQQNATANSPEYKAFVMGSMPESFTGSADAVFIVRALHNLARFEPLGGYLTQAIKDAYNVLKPGGMAGVVQHRAPETMPDDWANGSNGYLKQSFVTDTMLKAGFILVASSEINANPKDKPGEDDFVWRLPPSLLGSEDNIQKRAAMQAIGESDRMTLLFKKP